jgi:hypothetical protein
VSGACVGEGGFGLLNLLRARAGEEVGQLRFGRAHFGGAKIHFAAHRRLLPIDHGAKLRGLTLRGHDAGLIAIALTVYCFAVRARQNLAFADRGALEHVDGNDPARLFEGDRDLRHLDVAGEADLILRRLIAFAPEKEAGGGQRT